jgi:hypothetical protein
VYCVRALSSESAEQAHRLGRPDAIATAARAHFGHLRVRMRGRASQVDVQAIGAQVWTIRNGKRGSAKLYQSKAEALDALGLSE